MLVECHVSSPSLWTRVEVVCEGASQGGGPGRSIVEAHDDDMTNTGAEKSGCVVIKFLEVQGRWYESEPTSRTPVSHKQLLLGCGMTQCSK